MTFGTTLVYYRYVGLEERRVCKTQRTGIYCDRYIDLDNIYVS